MGKYFAYAIGMVLMFAPRLRADVTVTNGSPDTFANAVSNLVAGGGGTVFVTTPITVSNDVAEPIDGESVVTVSGGNTNSLFTVGSGSLVLANMTLKNGVDRIGGAMYIAESGTVTLTNCIFSNNSARGTNGVSADPIDKTNTPTNGKDGGRGTPGESAYGGAVYNLGGLTILNCKFITNNATGGKGGDGADGQSAGVRGGNGGRGGAGGSAAGGGVFNIGTLVVSNCTFSGNVAQGGSGGISGVGGGGLLPGVPGSAAAGGSVAGAGLYTADTNGTLVANSTFDHNTAHGGNSTKGGASPAGAGQNGVRGGDAFGGGVDNSAFLMVVNSTFFQNNVLGGAGGDGGDGGARAGNGGTGGSAIGGGLFNAGTVTVENCTFSKGNVVGGTNGVPGTGLTGGKNGKVGASFGGNIANVAKKKAGSFQLFNSIIAAALSGGGGYGTISNGGYNISADKSIKFKKGSNSLMNTNPAVGDLGDNGGPTETIPLKANSPAIDFVPPQLAPMIDQRGFNRPVGAASDAGAFEADTNLVTILTNPLSTNAIIGSNVTFTVIAGGTGPLFYQWYFNSNLLAGAITNSLSITNVQLTNAGNYFAVVSNAFNSVTSKVAVLMVRSLTNSPPVITQQPTNHQDAIVGTTVTISVTATSTVPVFYQWVFKDFATSTTAALTGATSNVLTIVNAQTTNSGSYWVIVTNSSGAVTSSISDLVVTNGSGNINPGGFLRIKGASPVMPMVLVPNEPGRGTETSWGSSVTEVRIARKNSRDESRSRSRRGNEADALNLSQSPPPYVGGYELPRFSLPRRG
jgi:hypothetical protein